MQEARNIFTPYQQVGNFPGYTYNQMRVVPLGVLTKPEIILKMYALLKRESPSPREQLRQVTLDLEQKITCGEILPESGLGFTIFAGENTETTLNVARWSNRRPHLLHNTLFECLFKDGITLNPLDIGIEGAYCAFELAIVDFERRLWVKYLQSKRTGEDKREYVHTMLQGPLENFDGIDVYWEQLRKLKSAQAPLE